MHRYCAGASKYHSLPGNEQLYAVFVSYSGLLRLGTICFGQQKSTLSLHMKVTQSSNLHQSESLCVNSYGFVLDHTYLSCAVSYLLGMPLLQVLIGKAGDVRGNLEAWCFAWKLSTTFVTRFYLGKFKTTYIFSGLAKDACLLGGVVKVHFVCFEGYGSLLQISLKEAKAELGYILALRLTKGKSLMIKRFDVVFTMRKLSYSASQELSKTFQETGPKVKQATLEAVGYKQFPEAKAFS